MMLVPRVPVDEDLAARVRDLAGDLVELSHMPSPRRESYLQRLVPELLDVLTCCDGPAPSNLVMQLAHDEKLAAELADALRTLASHPADGQVRTIDKTSAQPLAVKSDLL